MYQHGNANNRQHTNPYKQRGRPCGNGRSRYNRLATLAQHLDAEARRWASSGDGGEE
jgi:hypothetical protein